MGIILKKHVIRQGDRVQQLAASLLGDTTKWLDIVALNKLRRPYISDDLLDQLGTLQGFLPLQAELAAGSLAIIDWDSTIVGSGGKTFNSASLLVPGAILVFTYMDSFGDRKYDIVQITEVTQTMLYNNGHIGLQIGLLGVDTYKSITKKLVTREGGLLKKHVVGELFQVYGSPLQLTTAVARTGDVISLPVVSTNSNYRISSTKEIVESLGVDIALDASTGQKKASPTGDLATVAGVATVKQALRIRCQTEPGELLLHPEYGNTLKFYVGYIQNSGWPNLAIALLHDCLIQDPRVEEVLNMHFRSVGDSSYIDATIKINDSGQIFSTTVKVS